MIILEDRELRISFVAAHSCLRLYLPRKGKKKKKQTNEQRISSALPRAWGACVPVSYCPLAEHDFRDIKYIFTKTFRTCGNKTEDGKINITLGNQIWEHLLSFCCEPEYVAFNDDGPSIARHQQVLTSKIKLHRKGSVLSDALLLPNYHHPSLSPLCLEQTSRRCSKLCRTLCIWRHYIISATCI